MPRGREKKVPPGMEWIRDKPEWMRRPEVEARAKKEVATLSESLEGTKKDIKRLFGGLGVPFELACEMNDLHHETTEGRGNEIIRRYKATQAASKKWRALGASATHTAASKRTATILESYRDWIIEKHAKGWSQNSIASGLNRKTGVSVRTLNRWLAASSHKRRIKK